MGLDAGLPCGDFPDFFVEVFVVHEQHVMSRLIHALQEAIPAVVKTVEHVGKIVIVLAPDPVSWGSRKDQVLEFFCQDQRGLALLETKVLCLGVEDFRVAVTADLPRIWEPLTDFPRACMVQHISFDIDRFNHRTRKGIRNRWEGRRLLVVSEFTGSLYGYPDSSVKLYPDQADVLRTGPEAILLPLLVPAPMAILGI